MGRMGRARREVHEERLVRHERRLVAHPGNRLVGHVGHEVVVRVLRQLDLVHPVVEQRRPLVGLAADEAVELVEARPRRPAIGRPGRAHLPGRRLVRLAERGSAIAVQSQHLGQRRHVAGSLAGLSGKPGGGLGDRAHVVHMMVAPAQQRRAGRRAQRRRVELVVAQPGVGQPLHGRHANGPAERARLAEAHVVDEHDEYVRRLRRRLHFEARRQRGLARVDFRDRRRGRLRDRQYRPVRRQHYARRRGRLCDDGCRQRAQRENESKDESLHRFPPRDRRETGCRIRRTAKATIVARPSTIGIQRATSREAHTARSARRRAGHRRPPCPRP